MKKLVSMAFASVLMAGGAHASVVTTSTFSGQAQGGSTSTSTTALPAGGVLRADDPQYNYASSIGFVSNNPIVFNAGAAAAGRSAALADMTVQLSITNDTSVNQRASFGALIFAGAVGIANPNFADPSCAMTTIEACGSFLSGTPAINPGEQALLSFAAQLDGVTLFGGDISVDSTGMVSSFTPGFGLTAFGVDSANGNLFSWQDTIVSDIGLGLFAPGETKTLTYIISSSVATSVACKPPAFQCPVALSGFGDPPPGSGGVIITASMSQRQAQAISSFQSTISGANQAAGAFAVSFSQVPLPPAVLLFGAGLAALGAARRRKSA